MILAVRFLSHWFDWRLVTCKIGTAQETIVRFFHYDPMAGLSSGFLSLLWLFTIQLIIIEPVEWFVQYSNPH